MKIDLRNSDVQMALFFSFWIIGAIGMAIHHFYFINSDLKNSKSIKQIQAQFENDFKNIQTPPKTAVNKSEIFAKPGVVVSLKVRYRTELPETEVFPHFRKELEKLGWKFYERGNSPDYGKKTLDFRKGKFDAQLMLKTRSVWNDEADYYQLNFRFGNRN